MKTGIVYYRVYICLIKPMCFSLKLTKTLLLDCQKLMKVRDSPRLRQDLIKDVGFYIEHSIQRADKWGELILLAQ